MNLEPSGTAAFAAPFTPDEGLLAAGSAQVVIVDDDPGLRELLTEFLIDHGIRAEAVASGAALRDRLDRRPCDLIVLDMMMPGEDGLSVLRTLTQSVQTAGVIMFSALASEVDRIVALELGADDYVVKPSSPREILARIRSVLRRRAAALPVPSDGDATVEPRASRHGEVYGFAGWMFDIRLRRLRAPAGEVVRLTESEFRLLDLLVRHPQKLHSRDEMIDPAGRAEGASHGRNVDVNISRLRRKLLAFDATEIIRTVRGGGYMFLPEVTRL